MDKKLIAAGVLAWGVFTSGAAQALTITLDYSNDTGGYFAANPTAQNTLAHAATDIGAAISTVLNATTSSSSATVSGTTTTFNFTYSYTNPNTGVTTTAPFTSLAQDQFYLYVGRRNLTGTTLAQGGPGGVGGGVSSTGSASVVPAANASSMNLGRGGGPTIGTLNGTVGGTPFTVSSGDLVGNLWFDSDTDNNNITDSTTQFNTYFQTDYTQPVGSAVDLYSVALHEMLHSLGFGTSETWESHRSGTNWNGANAVALLGTGTNVVTADGHINGSLLSTVAGTNTSQTPVMVPSIGAGQRRFLTTLDEAFLKDLNYTVVPEPAALSLVAIGAMLLGRRRRCA